MGDAAIVGINVIVGLGNPGSEYAATRHNAGFDVIDELADQLHATYWKKQDGALVTVVPYSGADGGKLVLAKPQSYMNESGGPVKRVLADYGFAPSQLIVVHDELDTPPGDVRLKQGGGHAGHNGLRSIIDKVGTNDYARLRIGIGHPPGRMAVADFVLSQPHGEQLQLFSDAIVLGAQAVLYAVAHGVNLAMTAYNGKRE